MTNLWSILIETLKADPLCEGYTGNPPRLRAGYVVEASRKKILRHLGGFPTASVSCHHHHRVASHQIHHPAAVLEDGQVLLVPSELGQFPETLPLAEVQEVQESQAAVWGLLSAWTRGALRWLLPQTLLDVPGLHRDINPVPSIVLFRKVKIHLSSAGLPPVFSFFSVVFSARSTSRHVPLCLEPLKTVKKSPELFVFRAASLNVVMSAEKHFIQLGSALRTVPVPGPVSPAAWAHIHGPVQVYRLQRTEINMYAALQSANSSVKPDCSCKMDKIHTAPF